MQAIILGTGNHIKVLTPLEKAIHKYQSKVQNSCTLLFKNNNNNKQIYWTESHSSWILHCLSVSMTIKGKGLNKQFLRSL